MKNALHLRAAFVVAILAGCFSLAGAGSLTWVGSPGGNWAVGTDNWNGGAIFSDGDDVTFDDTAAGTTTVTVVGTVQPAFTVVNNASKAYTIGGGAIAGAGSLTKSGAGTLTLSGANTFGGGLLVNGGIVKAGAAAAIPGAVTVAAGGSFDTNGLNLNVAGKTFTLAGTGAAGQVGALFNSSTTAESQVNNVLLAGNATVGSSQRKLNFYGTSFNGGGFTLTTAGTSETNFRTDNALSNLAGITVTNGRLRFESSQNWTGAITVSGGILDTYGTRTESMGITFAGGTLQAWNGGATWSGPVVANAGTTSSLDGANGSLTFTGLLSGTGTLNVSGGNNVTFNASGSVGMMGNTGKVVLGPGVTLAVGGNNGSANWTGTVSGPSATLTKQGSGNLTLTPGAANSLGSLNVEGGQVILGNGNALGGAAATVASGATLAVNGNNVGSATIAGTGSASQGALYSSTGRPTISNLTLSGNATIGSADQGFVLSAINGNGNTLTVGGGYVSINSSGAVTNLAGLTINSGGAVMYDWAHETWGGPITVNTGGRVMGYDGYGVAAAVTLAGGTMGARQGTSVFSGPVTVNGSGILDTNPTSLWGGAGNLTVGGPISGSGSLTVQGPNTVLLSGNNAGFSGAIAVNSGTLRMGGTTAFGGTSGISVASGATLDLNGQNPGNGNARNVAIAGTGVGGTGALYNNVNYSQIQNLTLTADALVNSSSRIDVWGTVHGGSYVLTKTGAGEAFNFRGGITTLGGLVINQGRVRFEGGGLGAWTGPITINPSGILSPYNTGTTVAAITLAGGTLHAEYAGTANWNGPVTLSAGTTSTVDSTNANNTFGAAMSGSGTLNVVGGNTATFNASSTIGNLVNTGKVALGGGVNLAVGSNGGGAIWTGTISGATGTLTKQGGADLVLNPGSANSLGNLAVQGGRVFISNANAIAGNTAIAVTGGTLDFQVSGGLVPANAMSFASGTNLANRQGTLVVANATLPSAGTMIFNRDDQPTTPIALTGNWTPLTGDLTVQVGGQNDTVGMVSAGGSITGAGGLTKTGSGTLGIGGANSYAGDTVISAGTLELTAPAFQYYRFTQTALRVPATTLVQLSEMQMFYAGAQIGGATATNPGGNNPASETPDKAVDNNTGTKWLDQNKGPLVLNYGSPRVINQYRWATANDAIERDPVRWKLEGSNDNATWTMIDDRTAGDYATPTARFTYLPNLPVGTGVSSSAIPSGSAVRIAAGAALNLNAYNLTIGSLADSGGSGGSVVIGGGTLTTGGNGQTTAFSGAISGAGNLVKTGSGAMRLSGTNTYTGTTTASAGRLIAANPASLGAAASGAVVAAGAAIEFDGAFDMPSKPFTLSGSGIGGAGALNNTAGNTALGGAVTLSGPVTVGNSAPGTQFTLSSRMQILQPLTITGAGNTVLAGNLYDRDIDYASGFVSASNYVAVGSATIAGTALRLTDSLGSQQGSFWTASKLPAAGGFTTDFTLGFPDPANGGADGISFAVQNNSNSLNVGEAGPTTNALVVSYNSWNGGNNATSILRVLQNGTELASTLTGFDLSGVAAIQSRVVYAPGDLDVYLDLNRNGSYEAGELVFNSLNVNLASLGAVDAGGNAYLGFGSRTGGAWEKHLVQNWTYTRWDGLSPSLVKTGTGTLTLSGASTYNGNTVVNEGTLLVDGSITSGVLLNAGRLGGGGTVRGLVSVAPDGVLAPGASVGHLTLLGGLAMDGGVYEVEIDGLAGPGASGGNDLLSLLGPIGLDGELRVLLGAWPGEGNQFLVLRNNNTAPISTFFANAPEGGWIAAPWDGRDVLFQVTYQGADGNDVVLTSQVPEPASALLLMAGLTALARRIRRRVTTA